MVTTTVSETTVEREDGEQTQYRTTVPKQLAEALDLGGATLEWDVESQNAVRVTKVNDNA